MDWRTTSNSKAYNSMCAFRNDNRQDKLWTTATLFEQIPFICFFLFT